jgi:uncharacterized protein YjdB
MKNVSRLLCSVALLLLAAACGGGSSSPNPPPPPPPAPVASVTLTPATATLVPQQTTQLVATTKDASGNTLSSRVVTWNSLVPAVASVDGSGLVTAASPGTANITATSEGRVGTATITVGDGGFISPVGGTVTAAAGNVIVQVPAQALASATAITVAPVPNPQPDPKLIPGTAYDFGPTGTSFAQPVTLKIKYDAATLPAGANPAQFRVHKLVGTTWTVLAGSTVDVPTKTVTGQTSSFSTYAVLEVQAPVASVTFAPPNVTLDIGETATVTATVLDAFGHSVPNKTVQWLTSDASIVGGTVNGNSATLQGAGAGSATVTASVDGIIGNLPVTVRVTAPKPVASVTVTPASAAIAVGATLPMVATLRDAQGNVLTNRVVSWFSSNLSIANGVVDGNIAVIQGLSVGVVTISATSEGITGSSTVTVVAAGGTPIPLTCAGVAGGQIYAQNGQYLGRLTNQFDSQSILNTFGSYGSQFSSTSIYNTFSQYGSQFSSLSAYNPFTSTPPQLYVSGQFAAYVTKNTIKTPRIDPDALRSCIFP